MNTAEEFIGIKKENSQRVTRMAVRLVNSYLQLAIAGQSQFTDNRKYLVFEFRDDQLIMSASKIELAQNSVISTETLKNESTELDQLLMKIVNVIFANHTFEYNYDTFDDNGELLIQLHGIESNVTLRFICNNLLEYIREKVDNNFVNLTFQSNKYELIQELGTSTRSIS